MKALWLGLTVFLLCSFQWEPPEFPRHKKCLASYNSGPCCNTGTTTYWCTAGNDYMNCSLSGIGEACGRGVYCNFVQIVTCNL